MMDGVGLGALDPSYLGVLDPTSLLVLCFLGILGNYCKIRLFAGIFILTKRKLSNLGLRIASVGLFSQLG